MHSIKLLFPVTLTQYNAMQYNTISYNTMITVIIYPSYKILSTGILHSTNII